jgi:hypothetical protein
LYLPPLAAFDRLPRRRDHLLPPKPLATRTKVSKAHKSSTIV